MEYVSFRLIYSIVRKGTKGKRSSPMETTLPKKGREGVCLGAMLERKGWGIEALHKEGGGQIYSTIQ